MELSQDLEQRPIVFISFNSDEYEKDGETIKEYVLLKNQKRVNGPKG